MSDRSTGSLPEDGWWGYCATCGAKTFEQRAGAYECRECARLSRMREEPGLGGPLRHVRPAVVAPEAVDAVDFEVSQRLDDAVAQAAAAGRLPDRSEAIAARPAPSRKRPCPALTIDTMEERGRRKRSHPPEDVGRNHHGNFFLTGGRLPALQRQD